MYINSKIFLLWDAWANTETRGPPVAAEGGTSKGAQEAEKASARLRYLPPISESAMELRRTI